MNSIFPHKVIRPHLCLWLYLLPLSSWVGKFCHIKLDTSKEKRIKYKAAGETFCELAFQPMDNEIQTHEKHVIITIFTENPQLRELAKTCQAVIWEESYYSLDNNFQLLRFCCLLLPSTPCFGPAGPKVESTLKKNVEELSDQTRFDFRGDKLMSLTENS